jgi:hypothetical protein
VPTTVKTDDANTTQHLDVNEAARALLSAAQRDGEVLRDRSAEDAAAEAREVERRAELALTAEAETRGTARRAALELTGPGYVPPALLQRANFALDPPVPTSNSISRHQRPNFIWFPVTSSPFPSCSTGRRASSTTRAFSASF